MIQVYADGALVYDSRLEEYDLVGLKITNGLNVGGTAEITMPANHPAYNAFVSYKTIVTVYRDGVLRFRGRVLYPADNFYGERTITCEGEMCLLRDAISRPYVYTGDPEDVFYSIMKEHARQTDDFKHFGIGAVTATDPNDYIRLESESAETVLDTINKLIDRCGGYITFTDGSREGERLINWLDTLERESDQVIEFGENLLDFARTGANTTSLATGLIPYGAKDETTGKRLDIKSVNDGVDYILDNDAVALHGKIMATAVWDDVTVASNLLTKAKAWLAEHKGFITSLELTALDLSYLDKSLDRFAVGDLIRVVSVPHKLDDWFQLTQMSEDMLHPENSTIVLGKDVLSLTSADVAGDYQGRNEIEAVKVQIQSVPDLSGFVTTDDLNNYATREDLGSYVTADALGGYATAEQLADAQETLTLKITGEEKARKALIDLLLGETYVKGEAVNIGEDDTEVVHIRSTDRIKVHGRMHMMDGMLDFSNNQGVRCYNTDGTVVYILRTDSSDNVIVGTAGNKLYLRGPTVYLGATNAVVTSDRRNKNSIEELPDAYVEALDKLTPVRFKYNDGTSDRYHVGFIAQDVEQALGDAGLTSQDFGGFVDLNDDGAELGLAYDEFIGLLFQKIRKLEKRIEVLEE